MLNLTTKRIIITQDIRWLNCMLHDLDNAIHLPDTDMEYDEDDLNILEEVPSLHPTADPAPIPPTAPQQPPPGPRHHSHT